MPLRFSEFPDALDLQAPFLGEHNKEVFGEHSGLSGAELEALEKEGVLKSEPQPKGSRLLLLLRRSEKN